MAHILILLITCVYTYHSSPSTSAPSAPSSSPASSPRPQAGIRITHNPSYHPPAEILARVSNSSVPRIGMLVSSLGSVARCVFVMLALINVLQINSGFWLAAAPTLSPPSSRSSSSSLANAPQSFTPSHYLLCSLEVVAWISGLV
ncbi:hypothetical protein ACFX13_042143 [Malus domestica]